IHARQLALMMQVLKVTLQRKIVMTLLQRELPARGGAVKCNHSTTIPRKSWFQPNFKAARWPVRTRALKHAGAQYRSVITETETVLIVQPMHLILGRMKRP